jgi:hypothetical protein
VESADYNSLSGGSARPPLKSGAKPSDERRMGAFTSIDVERITIPRWTIKEEARLADCPDCGMPSVRVGVDNHAYIFCSCQLIIELLPRAQS